MEPNTTIQDEPKFIVFYSVLATLFSMFCFKCKRGKPQVSMKTQGTFVTVCQTCTVCGEDAFTWRSQPLIFGRYPAGNLLLSFAVLMAGSSISKILLVFRHMGLCAINPWTYFVHQSKFVFPAILQYWETYRNSLIQQIRGLESAVWSGDGRFDSMGHCAKFGAYTMFCNSIMKVVHFELLQVCLKVVG